VGGAGETPKSVRLEGREPEDGACGWGMGWGKQEKLGKCYGYRGGVEEAY
jgi:hypothetical protein